MYIFERGDLRSGAGVKSLLYTTNEQMPRHISIEYPIHSSTHNYNSIKLKILNIRPEELNSSNVYAHFISSPLLTILYLLCGLYTKQYKANKTLTTENRKATE